jgi:hypothetical protein
MIKIKFQLIIIIYILILNITCNNEKHNSLFITNFYSDIYIEMDKFNTSNYFFFGTPTFDRFFNDKYVNTNFKYRDEFTFESEKYANLDSIIIKKTDSLLEITHIYLSKGSCTDFISVYSKKNNNIQIWTPEIIYYDTIKFKTEKNISDIPHCEITNYFEITTTLKILKDDNFKEIYYNDSLIN